jgi:hypothetical protein
MKIMKNTKPKTIVHGECFIFQNEIPVEATLEKHEQGYVIIADSETTGNHHVIDRKPKVNFYKLGNRRFIDCGEETVVRCLVKDRHDTIPLKKGTYEIGIQQEYDYFEQALRNVRD